MNAGATVFQLGADAETVEDALNAILALNDQWYFVTLDQNLNDTATVEDVRAWVAPQVFLFSNEANDSAVLTTGETTSITAQIAALEPDRTFTNILGNDRLQSLINCRPLLKC